MKSREKNLLCEWDKRAMCHKFTRVLLIREREIKYNLLSSSSIVVWKWYLNMDGPVENYY